MTQEDKELLLKDICARLPYGLCVQDEYGDIVYVSYNDVHFANYFDSILNGIIKPYLFPLSNITDEQWRELFETAGYEVREEDCGRHTEMYYYDLVGYENVLYPNSDAIDWLNKNHFDYRGLIPKGFAIDATGKGIY